MLKSRSEAFKKDDPTLYKKAKYSMFSIRLSEMSRENFRASQRFGSVKWMPDECGRC